MTCLTWWTYGSLFPYPPPQFEDLFFALLNRIGSWPLDSSEYVLMSLMVLFCPDDMPDLVDRKTVEEIQNYYAVLLQKYLNKKHTQCPATATIRFSQGVSCLVSCKELHDLLSKVW